MITRTTLIAVYKGDEQLCTGTLQECAEKLGIREETLRFYTTPAYQRRIAKRKHSTGQTRAVVNLEDDDEDDAS